MKIKLVRLDNEMGKVYFTPENSSDKALIEKAKKEYVESISEAIIATIMNAGYSPIDCLDEKMTKDNYYSVTYARN